MQQELATRLGAFDQTVAADAVKLKRWLNRAYRFVMGEANWVFSTDYEIIQTITDITTGTVDVTAGGSTLTFSSGPADSVSGRYIKFSTADDWYKITAHTAASTSATISPTYGQTSNLTAGTFTIRKLLYATTTPFDSYLDIKKTVSPGRLTSLNRSDSDFFLSLYLETGEPLSYVMGPLDSSNNLQFSLANPPSSVINLLVRGIKRISDMSADSDVPTAPDRWHDLIVDFGAHYGFMSTNDARAKAAYDLGKIKLANMSRVYDPDLGRHRIVGETNESEGFGPIFTLPSNFGRQF